MDDPQTPLNPLATPSETPLTQPPGKKRYIKLAVLVVVGVLLVSVIAAVVLSKKSSDTPAANNSAAAEQLPEVKIAITPQGFMPETITVKQGQTVTWTNTDTNSHQPMSGPHPQHDDLEGLAAPTALLTGDSYSYTFSQTGTFTYHDEQQLNVPAGTVIVE